MASHGAGVALLKACSREYNSAAKRLPRGVINSLCKIAAKRLVNKALQLRKEHAGVLLKTARAVNGLNITVRDDFGEGCHTASSEPYFYDSALDACDDGCPNQHYTKSVARGDSGNEVVDLQGRPLVCFNDGGCGSRLRMLRAASTHHGVLHTLLNHVHSAIASHLGVLNIDKALRTDDLHALMRSPRYVILLAC